MQPDFDLPAEFLPPDYKAGSIANVPATVSALLGVPFAGLGPLRQHMWQPLAGDVQRVVLLLVDALGWQMVERAQAAFAALTSGKTAVLDQMTSIFPSTTVAALSSVWTGYAPAQHGLVGLHLLTPEHGTLTQFINFTPVFGKYPDALIDAGLDPEGFLAVPGFAEQLKAGSVPTHRFRGHNLIDSALSRMHGRGVTASHGAVSVADMFVQMRQMLEDRAGERLFMSAYWPTVDNLMHFHGWDHPSVTAETEAILRQLKLELLDPLSAQARAGTVFILMADHGQTLCPPSQYIRLRDHPELNRMLVMRPAGEPRVPYFYARQGRQEEVLAYLQTHFAEAMVAMPASTALAADLLGPAPHAVDAAHRLGDVVGIMRQGYSFLTDHDLSYAHRMKGRHGGMSHLEMTVPWLGCRLD